MGAAVGAAAAPAAKRRGRAMLVALAALPWLGLFLARAGQGASSLLGGALAILAAMHGAGALVAWAASSRGTTWLRVSWGAAALIAAGGALMMVGGYGARGQSALLFLGVIAHSAELVRGARSYATALGGARGWRWPLLMAALVGVAMLHALGHAGAAPGSAWEGEANLLGQLRSLDASGHLADIVGFARSQSLGGGLVLSALGELASARMIDSLGMAVLLALTAARLLQLDGEELGEGALWAGLVVLAGMTFSRLPSDAALYWWPAALLAAGAITLERQGGSGGEREGSGAAGGLRHSLPAVLIAAALAVMHHALIAAALAMAGAALWPHRRRRGALAFLALAIAAVAPYAVERMLARGALSAQALALLVPPAGFSPLRLSLTAAVAAVLAPLVRCLVEDRRLAVLFGAALAAGLSPFAAARPHAGAYVLVAVLALFSIAVVRLARARGGSGDRALPLGAALLSICLLVSLYEAQERGGGMRWSYRWTALSSAAGYVVSGPVAAPSVSPALLAVPDGATVALWISQPERLDPLPEKRRLFDLRTPHLIALHRQRPERFFAALSALAPDFLLYEEPLAERATLAGQMCATFGACDDGFARLAATHRTVWRGEGLRLLAWR